MTKKRQNESAPNKKRNPQRCYNIDNQWYFELRGGGQHGPYDSQPEMEAALQEFLSLHHEMQQRGIT